MMGSHQPQNELFNYQVNLEKRVRADHPLRRINAMLDLSFVRPAVAQFYGNNGHVGVDPIILVKMMLLMFLDDVASERELMGVIRERLDYLWFLGYGLDDEVPNHSVLSKARARWGSEVFCRLFVQTVEQQKFEGLESQAVNANHVSTTDPDATLGKGGGSSASQLSYKHHRVVDNAQGVITAVKTTTGCAGDAGQLPGLVQQHEKNAGSKASTAIGDKHYGSAENYRYCQQRQIAAHLGQAQAYVKGYPVSAFVYESERDRYRCPAGHYLYYHNFKKEDQLIEYRIEQASLCANCQLRAQCTKSKTGRSVTRPLFSELVEAGRGQADSPAARQDRRRRKHLMEGSFADAANNHGFKRARWRGLWRQQIQDWMIAAVQNLRILMKKTWKWASEKQASGILSLIACLKTLFALQLFCIPIARGFKMFIPFGQKSLGYSCLTFSNVL